MLRNRVCLLAKIESSTGVDAVPTVAANEVEIFEIDLQPKFEKITRKPLRPSLSPQPIKKSKKVWELEITTELKGSGSLGVPGRLSPLFKAAALTEGIVTGASYSYVPGTPASTVTFYVYQDGLLSKITGAVCTGCSIELAAGKIATIKWKFRGKYATPTDAALPTPTYEATIGVPVESANFQISGFAGVFRSLTIDLGLEAIDRASMNAAGALEGFNITGRTPTAKLLMEGVLRATEDVWAEHDAATLITLQGGPIGSVEGNRVSIAAASKVQYDDLKISEEDGMIMYDLGLVFSGTDDELTLSFT